VTKKILIAEDDAALRTLLVDLMSDEGYDVTGVEDGSAAKLQLSQYQFDLIILDYMMPEMTGVEVCAWLRQADLENRTVPVILLTAKAQEKDRERAREAQVNAYVVKPFSPMQFTEVVESMLSRGNA
jgi:DNA-binding response OmpR family regulator